MTVKRAIVIFLVVFFTLLVAFLLASSAGAEVDGEFGYLPVHPWYRGGQSSTDCWRWWHPDGWKIEACCLDNPANPPYEGQEYYRDGDKLFPMAGNNQPMKIIKELERPQPTPTPEPKEYRLYLPMAFSGYKFYRCDCQYHTCVISINTSVWRTLYLLEYPKMGTVSGVLNLDASKNQKLNVRCHFKGGSVHNDPGYSYTVLIIDCKGKPSYQVNCPNGICPSIGCGGLNGTAPCVATSATYTCDKICRGKWNMTDTP